MTTKEPTVSDDDELKRKQKHFNFVVEDAKRYFGEWDMCDPVAWAILRVVQAQNDFAHAICEDASYGRERMVEAAIAERREAIAALQRALEQEPRGFQ